MKKCLYCIHIIKQSNSLTGQSKTLRYNLAAIWPRFFGGVRRL